MTFQNSTSFLKVLLEDNFTEEIRIPPAFAEYHEDKLTKEWIIKTAPSKKLWSVQVDQNGGHYHLCGLHWKRYAEAQNLMYGDILLFRYVGETSDQYRLSVFDVVLYDGSGLPKSRPPTPLGLDTTSREEDAAAKDGIGIINVTPSSTESARLRKRFIQNGPSDKQVGSSNRSRSRKSKRSKATEIRVKEEVTSEDEDDDEEVEMAGKIKLEDKALDFELTFTKSYISRMYFPAAFAREAKLDKKKIIYLISQYSGKKWKMEICASAGRRISIGRGWSCFRDENNVKTGDTYIFTLIQDEDNNMLLVQKVE